MDRELVLATVSELAVRFVNYDRMYDKELSAQDLQQAVDSGMVTIEELVREFKIGLLKWQANLL